MVENKELEQQMEHDMSIYWSLFVHFSHATELVINKIQNYYELLVIDSQEYKALAKRVGVAKAKQQAHQATEKQMLTHEEYRNARQLIQKCNDVKYLMDKISDYTMECKRSDVFPNDAVCFDSVEATANYLCRLLLYAFDFQDPATDTLKLESTAKILAKGKYVQQEIIDKFRLK